MHTQQVRFPVRVVRLLAVLLTLALSLSILAPQASPRTARSNDPSSGSPRWISAGSERST